MTNETRHTPGEWEIHERFKHSYAIIICDEDGTLQTEVAWLGQSSNMSHEENLANARLISKAPELLKALDTLTGTTCDDCMTLRESGDCHTIDCAVYHFKQLVARVKGETNV